jgi:hypothetical protein
VHVPFANEVFFKLPDQFSVNHDCYSGTLREALWMFVLWSEAGSKYKRECRAWLAVAVANKAWSQSIRRGLGAYARKPT